MQPVEGRLRGVADRGILVLARGSEWRACLWLLHHAKRFGGIVPDPGEFMVKGGEQSGNIPPCRPTPQRATCM